MQRRILFHDLRSGGRALAGALTSWRDEDPLVLGIVRGGVPLASEVAASLGTGFDVIVRRSLFARSFEDTSGVVNVAGVEVLDEDVREPAQPSTGEEFFVSDSLATFRARVAECRGSSPPLDVTGRTVIVVDNGIRSSLTMGTSIKAVRRLAPARVVAATPLCAPNVADRIRDLADEFVCLEFPEPFAHVGMFYGTLDVPSEMEIRAALEASRREAV